MNSGLNSPSDDFWDSLSSLENNDWTYISPGSLLEDIENVAINHSNLTESPHDSNDSTISEENDGISPPADDIEVYEENEGGNTTVGRKKRNRSCAKIATDYPEEKGKDLKELVISKKDTEKYKRLESFLLKCEYCKKDKSILELYKAKDWFVCKDCAKTGKIPPNDLRKDIYEHLYKIKGLEDFDFKNEELYKCHRLGHCKPAYCFIRYCKKLSKHVKVVNCCYCRKYKAQEYVLKKKRKIGWISLRGCFIKEIWRI